MNGSWRPVLATFLLCLGFSLGGKPLQSIQVTLKGNVYHISDVATVTELQQRLQEESGLDVEEQGSATFQGSVLEPMDELEVAGVKSGYQINMIPQKMAENWKVMKEMKNGLLALHERVRQKGVSKASSDDIKELEIMTNLFKDLTKVPYMQADMERFSEALKNPEVLERAKDPMRVEKLRQIILNNPLMMKFVSESPATRVALQDPDIWLGHVSAAVEKWKTMDGYTLWQRLSEGRLFG